MDYVIINGFLKNESTNCARQAVLTFTVTFVHCLFKIINEIINGLVFSS